MTDNVYLDNAATTWPKPEPVYTLMDRFSRDIGVNPGRGGHALAAEAERLVRETRRLLAACFGHAGSIDRVVFTLNGTESLNLALNALVTSGARVVTTGLEHNAVSRTLAHLERDRDARIEIVAPSASGYVELDSLDNAMTGADLLVVNHASNVIGTVQPLEAIAALARRHDVAFVVDAAQTAGVVPIDVDALGIDVLTAPGHKGLFGPMGSGMLIVRDGVELSPLRVGGTGIDSASVFQPDALPHRLEAGTLATPAIAGLFAAQLWFAALGRVLERRVPAPDEGFAVPVDIEMALDDVAGWRADAHAAACRRAFAHVHAVELGHVAALERHLARHPRVRLLGMPHPHARVATLGFTVEGMSSEEVADRLDADHGICSRAGLQCAPWAHRAVGTLEGGGSVRLSPGYFTTAQDIEQLGAALDDLFA